MVCGSEMVNVNVETGPALMPLTVTVGVVSPNLESVALLRGPRKERGQDERGECLHLLTCFEVMEMMNECNVDWQAYICAQ